MLQIGIPLKNRADVELAYELSGHAGQIRAVDYSPYLRFFIGAEDKLALTLILREKALPLDKTVEKKLSANYFLTRMGSPPVWRTNAERVVRPYGTQIIELPLSTVSAFEVGEVIRDATPHSDIVRVDIRWLLRFPLDVVRIAVDTIQVFINRADTPTAVQTAEDLLSDIELKLIRFDGL